MGYYTDYILTVHDKDNHRNLPVGFYIDSFQEELEKIAGYTFHWDGNKFSTASIKWYNHEDDMILISKLYPDWVFMLKGHGEGWSFDDPDIWIAIIKNGEYKKRKAQIVLDESF